ncbi:abortive infection family protein [Robbsia sp. Bb-Pol-6]|uniref:Abortive infection family protein n=1 Tax=Robbsia betulipollinis TaxID=2981849 RepID=A0ABT3ZTZ3_9BURK|nr:abortive infection family protein [Robbsia betulipollinis]MCY0389932.1 abortive infection family protein [Robbsia betulipollinis]
MSSLTSRDRRLLEPFLDMEGGYVLNFSSPGMEDFFREQIGVNIGDEKYQFKSSSKANRMRAFWVLESDAMVAKALDALIEWGDEFQCLKGDKAQRASVQQIITRLKSSSPIPEVDAFTASVNALDFQAASKHIKAAIDANEPATALDRVHVFLMKFLRTLCEKRGIEVTRDKPLHSLMGEYVKHTKAAGHLESQMTERILKSAIANLEAMNTVRNEQSLAHDNPMLNHDEAVLIVSHVGGLVRFMKSLEAKIKASKP